MTAPTVGFTTSDNMSAIDVAFLRGLVLERSAIVLDESKHYLLAGRLDPLVRREKLSGISELVEQVRRAPRGRLENLVIEAMTTNETSFFRDVHPFTTLVDTIVPEILSERGATAGVTVWCGASSSGQEPYSIAIAVSDRFPDLMASGRLKILATDLSPAMVERTKAGRFSQLEVNRGLPARQLVRFFQQEGNEWVAKRELRNVIDARPLNLIGPWTNMPRCDIVFLRNVLIYFNGETKRTILERIRKEVLRPGGHLFLGSSETTLNIDANWSRRSIGRSISYEAPGGNAPRANSVPTGAVAPSSLTAGSGAVYTPRPAAPGQSPSLRPATPATYTPRPPTALSVPTTTRPRS